MGPALHPRAPCTPFRGPPDNVDGSGRRRCAAGASTPTHPGVDVTYQADFSVDGGRWRPVDGTVTIEGDPQTLQTLTATPHLVD